MTKYTVTLAFDVPCYAEFEVEVNSEKEATDLALEQAQMATFEPAWDCSGETRVVDIIAEAQNVQA